MHRMSVVEPELRLQPTEERWLERLGWQAPFHVFPLRHGRNNQVLRILDARGQSAVLKRFFKHEQDRRDRLGHEWSFLQFAKQHAPDFVPAALAMDRQENLLLMEYIEGEPLTQDVTQLEVRQAMQFLAKLNSSQARSSGGELPMAADACLLAWDHGKLLTKRIEAFADLKPETEPEHLAQRFIDCELRPASQQVLRSLKDLRGQGELVTISPSDFGFHNALLEATGGIRFLDFEYAGIDGIGKLLADFLCQPAKPVSDDYLGLMVEELKAAGIPTGPHFDHDFPRILAAHRLKWCGIMLNEFSAAGAARRAFAKPGTDPEKRCLEQLEAAQEYYQTRCEPLVRSL